MSSLREITFFGANYRVAQLINGIYPVTRICCERRVFNLNLHDFACLHGAEFKLVEKRADLVDLPEMPYGLGISCGFGIIFKNKTIDKFGHGMWNIHYGKLPDIRGRHPISWAFLRGDDKFYVTIHEIDEGIGTGDIIAQRSVNVEDTDTGFGYTIKLFEECPRLFIDSLEKILSGYSM